MIHIHMVPQPKPTDPYPTLLWTIYAPTVEDADRSLVEDIAAFVDTTMREHITRKGTAFTIGFMPLSWSCPRIERETTNITYVVVTKDVDTFLENLPELVRVEQKRTLFIIPNYAPKEMARAHQNQLDVVADSQFLFYLTLVMIIIAWLLANLVYQ